MLVLNSPQHRGLPMPSERGQRNIERLLDEADEAISRSDWALARDRAQNAAAHPTVKQFGGRFIHGAPGLPSRVGAGEFQVDLVVRVPASQRLSLIR